MKRIEIVKIHARDEYFSRLKNSDCCGVILKMSPELPHQLNAAMEAELSVWISVPELEQAECEYICAKNGIVKKIPGFICFAGIETIEKVHNMLSAEQFKYIDGFVVCTPSMSGLLWTKAFDDEFKKSFSMNIDDAYAEMFDEEKTISPIRSWYYDHYEQYIFERLILPVADCIKKMDKRVVCNVGKSDMQYQFARNGIKVSRLYDHQISLAAECDKGCFAETAAWLYAMSELKNNILITSVRMRTGSFHINLVTANRACNKNDCMEENTHADRNAEVLLITPMRGIVQRDALRTGSGMMIENPATVASVESKFYSDLMYAKGISFGAADEYAIESFGSSDEDGFHLFGKCYKHLWICQSCTFDDKGIDILNDAAQNGVYINDSELSERLSGDL